MVEYKGSWFPVAYGWLPNKETLSYHLFFLLLLGEFNYRDDEIRKLYGKSKLKLKTLKLDFEVAMHNACKPLFKLEGIDWLVNFWSISLFFSSPGCMFHQGQAIQRQVQEAGLARAYIYHPSFTNFVRRLCAISFLPLTEVELGTDELESYTFTNISSASLLNKIEKFKTDILAYFRRVWLHGSYPPKVFLDMFYLSLF